MRGEALAVGGVATPSSNIDEQAFVALASINTLATTSVSMRLLYNYVGGDCISGIVSVF